MNFKINEIPKFVINLNRRTDRLEEVKKEFDYMGWSFERFDAFDTSGYTGCGYSHKRIAEIVIERNYDYAMICEDDIFFMPYTKELLTILEEQLNNNEWDFFSLAPSLHRPVNKFNNELIDLTNLPPKDEKIHRGIYSAACYIMTNKMAHVISKWNTNEVIQNQNLHIPIDMYFDLAIYPKYKSLTYKLPLVTQKPGFSNINNTNDSNHYLITYNWNVYSPEKISPKYFDYFISKRERDSQSKKVKFITSIYSDLFGTNFGGRPNRNSHYRWSLLSLLKMTNADFVCYTSDREYESLKTFFYKERNISEQKLKFIVFDLENHKFKELFEKYKDFDKAKKGDRCIEIQYMKYIWFMNEDLSYDYYFWIDAGLSHCGIIPNKYLKTEGNYYEKFYESNLFNNKFLKNLVENTKDKFTIIGKENVRNYWSGTVNSKHFTNYDRSIHVIGGLFGGKKELWKDMVELFEKYVYQVTQSDGRLYHEEDIMTLMFRNHPDKFINYYFETWWHENERVSGLNMDEHIKNNKSFYKIIEELNV